MSDCVWISKTIRVKHKETPQYSNYNKIPRIGNDSFTRRVPNNSAYRTDT